MARSIGVQPAKLSSAATIIISQADDYERVYKQLFSEVDGMGAAWQGIDNQAFVTQISEFTIAFQQMTALMREYADFLNQSSKTYSQAQNDTVTSVKRLTN